MSATQRPRIHCVIPTKERFSPLGAGAFALNLVQSAPVSIYRDAITVFGMPTDRPFADLAFEGIAPGWNPFVTRDARFARAYGTRVGGNPPDLIETFNRPSMARILAGALNVPVTLYIANDPGSLKGARTPKERAELLRRLAKVYCVSKYIYDRYADGLEHESLSDAERARLATLYIGMRRPAAFPSPKEPIVVFIGRVIPEKGVLELVSALSRVLPRRPEWQAYIIGAQWYGSGRSRSRYERAVANAAAGCERIHLLGFVANQEAMQFLSRAAIAAVPSTWPDPLPRAGLEALSQGCALICSTLGGLPELGAERALFLRDVSTATVEAALERLMTEDSTRAALQRAAWETFPFKLEDTVRAWDDHRAALLGRKA
jgi:glycosyltransferase involved in cell wall biosynthesis